MSQYLLSARAQQLTDRVASHYGFEFADLTAQCRESDVMQARHVAMYVLRHGLKLSYPHIGKLFKRDHTTVISSVAAAERKPHLKEIGDRIIDQTFPEASSPPAMVTDQGLRQFLAELDRKVEQARELRTLLTGSQPTVEVIS